ncbi:MAG: MarR family winged helix-turn-helix transcriptional regulator [Polyangia bacterium]
MKDSQPRLSKSPDFAILVAAAYGVVASRLLGAMEGAGITGMRPAYGFVIRAVAAESPTINRLAELLGVSKQAASKLADDMHRAGFLERSEDTEDRRHTRLTLSRKGKAVFTRALRVSRSMERSLRARAGSQDVDAFLRVLTAFIEQHGLLEDVLARRAKPVL